MAGRAAVIAYDVPSGHPARQGQQELVHQCFAPGSDLDPQSS